MSAPAEPATPKAARKPAPARSARARSAAGKSPAAGAKSTSAKSKCESSAQTVPFRFIRPPMARRRLATQMATYGNYIRALGPRNVAGLASFEPQPDTDSGGGGGGGGHLANGRQPEHWLGAGIGRHHSAGAALWALRNFMLQDCVAMRRSTEPYV